MKKKATDPFPAPATKSLLIASPVYDTPQIAFVQSVERIKRSLDKIGMSYGYYELCYESLIPRARNKIVDFFLKKSSATHLLQIDSDIGFEPADVLRLLQSNLDFCAAPYPAKHLGGRLIGNPFSVSGERVVRNGFCLAADLPTGFMMTSRGVFERLIAGGKVPEVDCDIPGGGRSPYHVFFDCGVDGRQYLSEDWWFSRLCLAHGVNGWLDMKAKLRHVGRHAFEAPSLEEQDEAKG